MKIDDTRDEPSRKEVAQEIKESEFVFSIFFDVRSEWNMFLRNKGTSEVGRKIVIGSIYGRKRAINNDWKLRELLEALLVMPNFSNFDDFSDH